MTHVLIVGSGPTGLTLAIELARRGIEFRIVEKSTEPPAGVRGKGLQPRTLEVFDDLGVIDEILATGREYPSLRGYQGDRVVWEGRMDELREPSASVPYPNLIMQPQWRTERILRDRLAALGHRVEFGAELTGFEQDGDGVTATLTGGERVRCAYLVGADGGRSTVRKRLGVGFAGETFESERMMLADIRTRDLDHDHWHAWGSLETRAVHFTICPLPDTDLFQLVAPGEGDIAALVAEHAPHVRIDEIVWRSDYRVNIRMAERFRVGRVFLAGDAAHVHSPAGGQGLNTGVQDAYNLGWKLAVGSEALLATYEDERMAVAEHVLGLSTRLLRTGDVRRGDDTNQLDLAYLGSPLSVGERGGERLGTLFAEQRGTGLLLLGEPAGDHPARVLPPLDGQRGVILVRPDGYIGYHGEESGLSAYLSGFGIEAPLARAAR
ncbi:FAD-dependent monooxygenase [Nonomuraea jiangxiensis]|uniref:2-polyprenyl-6-methoxyphenol hydroxylase n=1 Tax=Nonomuraea jiangxiensis TaxID=633440 RepID=A0A1G9CFH0_9ACTN|nr:FAD-dependent monooxygenase [Nonomuraea jiangxiensis]SDK50421.1 2-polyprenyl-6-methoxyphenol hydroxylase [Nonomuraea jiangxiensis]